MASKFLLYVFFLSLVKICSQNIPERILVTIYSWDRRVWEKKFDEVIEIDPDYALERKMPKRAFHTDADGSGKCGELANGSSYLQRIHCLYGDI